MRKNVSAEDQGALVSMFKGPEAFLGLVSRQGLAALRQCRTALGRADFLLLTGDLRSNPLPAADVRAYAAAHFDRAVVGGGGRPPDWELWVRSR